MDIEAADFEPEACVDPHRPPSWPAPSTTPASSVPSSDSADRAPRQSSSVAAPFAATVQALARRSGRSMPLPSGTAVPAAPVLPASTTLTDVDLSDWSVAQLNELSPVQRAALGRHCLRLTLPSGVSADTVRQWLRACPKLQTITALDIQADGCLIAAARAADLREFKTTPPGPSHLCLGLDTRLVVPDEQVVPPDLSRLRGWVANPDTLPRLSPDTFLRVDRLLRDLLLGSASALRTGLEPGDGLRRTMVALMEAAPPELLRGTAQRNHAAVLDFVRHQYRIHYWGFLNFVRPTLLACWKAVVRAKEPRGYEPTPLEELQVRAALRAWALSETPQESVGLRERVEEAAILAGLRDPQAIAHLLHPRSPERDDETLASPPLSEVTSPVLSPVTSPLTSPITSPLTSPLTSPVEAPTTPPQFMSMGPPAGPERMTSLVPPGTAGSGRGWR